MFFKNKNKNIVELSNQIYKLIIKQARIKLFYTKLNIPDTIDGRFELIVLHFFFIDNALNKEVEYYDKIYKEILEIMYKDFDMSLREMGVGDLSVGKKIYHMTEAFSGRIVAYRAASKKNKTEVIKSLKKNVYGTTKNINKDQLKILAEYFLGSLKVINNITIDNVKKNNAIFLDLNRYISKLQKGN